MDPDANWEEAVQLANRLQLGDYTDAQLTEQIDDGSRLGELVTSLDDWMKKGGFPPEVFTANRFRK
jgi:hypothetical protein